MSEHIFSQLRPIQHVDRIREFYEALEKGKVLDPNRGMMTQKAYEEALESYKQSATSLPIVYQPILVQAGVKLKAQFAFTGQSKDSATQPADWPEGEPWTNRCKLEKGRLCHIPDARKLADNDNIIQIGYYSYVIGNDESAIFSINASSSGINGHAILEGKRLSFAGMEDEISNLVGQFNPTLDTVVLDDSTSPGPEMVISPNMVVQRWGHLKLNGKTQTYAQIRKLIADDKANQLAFSPLSAPIVGTGFNRQQLSETVTRILLNTVDENGQTGIDRYKARKGRTNNRDVSDSAWYNLSNTLCRTNPAERTPFGFYSLQCRIVPCKFFSDDGQEELIRFVIDCFVGEEWKENGWDARRKLNAKVPTKKAPAKSSGQPKPRPQKSTTKKPPAQKKSVHEPIPDFNDDSFDIEPTDDDLLDVDTDELVEDDEIFIPEAYEGDD